MKEFYASKGILEVKISDDLSHIIENHTYEMTKSNFYKLDLWKHVIKENVNFINCDKKAKIKFGNTVEHIKPKKTDLSLYESKITIPIKTRASPSAKSTAPSFSISYPLIRPSYLLSQSAFRKIIAFPIDSIVNLKKFKIIIHIPKGFKVVKYKATYPAKINKSTLSFELNNFLFGSFFICLVILAPNLTHLFRIFRTIGSFIVKLFFEELFKNIFNKPPGSKSP